MLEQFFPFLDTMFYGATIERWIFAAIIVVLAFTVGKTIYYLFKTVSRKITSKTETKLDDILIDLIEEPIVLLAIIAGLYIGFAVLGLTGQIADLFYKAMTVVVTFAVAWLAIRLVDAFIKEVLHPLAQKSESVMDDQLIPIARKVSKIVIIFIAIIITLSNLGFDVTALIAGLGIGGIAIAFAAQETIANIFGGASIMMDKSILVGDRIRLDSGEDGDVQEITLRSTSIKTLDNKVVIIPNGVLAKAIITNLSRPDRMLRQDLSFGVEYGSDIDKVVEIVTKAVEKVPNVSKKNKVEVLFMSMGDFSLNFVARFWVDDYSKAPGIKHHIYKAIYNALNEAKIGIPFPTRVIYTKELKA